MPRPSKKTKIVSEYFTWILFTRDGVYYSDGRGAGLKKYSLGTRDRDEAIAKLRRLDRKVAVQRGLCAKPTEPCGNQLTIVEGWQRFLDHCGRPSVMGGVASSTLDRYRPIRDHHVEFCNLRGIENWSQIDKSATEDYGSSRNSKIAATTLKTELDVVVSVLNYLVEEAKLLPASQLFSLGLINFEDSDRYCFEREEVSAMIKHCRQTADLQWFADVIIGFAATGLRNASLCGLRWTEVDLAAGVILIRDQRYDRRMKGRDDARTMKGKRHHCLPINLELREMLERQPRGAKDGLVFHRPDAGRLTSELTLDILKKRVIEPLKSKFPTPPGTVGFEHAVIHSFRHFFCSEAYRQNANEAEILAWLGNRDSKMLKRYRHLRPDDGQAKMKQISFFDDDTGSSSS